MNLHTAPVDTICDVLLDGGLSESQHWSIDRRMERDSELADAVELQQQIRETVERSFAIPDLDAMLERVTREAEAQGRVSLAQQASLGGVPVLLKCAAGLLVCCLAFWTSPGDPETTGGPGTPEAIRRVESNLSEAVVLGVAGVAAMIGSRRLFRGRQGRFILEQAGMRLLLPETTEKAIALFTETNGSTLVYRTPSGVRAVWVVEPSEAARVPASDRLSRRSLGGLVLIGLGDPLPRSSLSRFDLLPAPR